MFINFSHAKFGWFKLTPIFNLHWVFYNYFRFNISQLIYGPALLNSTAKLLWVNVVKVFLSELWLERNQRIFRGKQLPWHDRFESTHVKTSSCCYLTKLFVGFLLQDILTRVTLQPTQLIKYTSIEWAQYNINFTPHIGYIWSENPNSMRKHCLPVCLNNATQDLIQAPAPVIVSRCFQATWNIIRKIYPKK